MRFDPGRPALIGRVVLAEYPEGKKMRAEAMVEGWVGRMYRSWKLEAAKLCCWARNWTEVHLVRAPRRNSGACSYIFHKVLF